jgi:hypothetical protein
LTALRALALVIVLAIIIAGLAIIEKGATAQERQFDQCQLEALKRFSDDTGVASKFSSYIAYCMGAGGYEVEYRPADQLCRIGDPIRNSIESCYVPMGRFSRWLQKAEGWAGR